jgi:uncharacterized protein YkwD
MSGQRVTGWVFAACLLLSSAAFGQSVERHERDSTEPQPPAPTQAHKPDLAEVEKLVVNYTNEFRKQQGRRPLKVNDKLSKAAHDFADFLARTDTFSHTADGKQPSQRVSEHGYAWCAVAENIAWEYNSDGFTTEQLARQLVEGWKHSPEHRRNLLDPDVTEVGVAVAYGKASGRYYGVQDFARPKSMALSFQVANQSDVEVRYTVDGKPFTLPPRYTRTHERCRSAAVEFLKPGDEEGEVLHPRKGTRYVLRPDGAGGYRVEAGPS